jgi:biopolymer transport protein ExbD
MRLPQSPSPSLRRISLTPLIDIVFILLLFFILESNFLRFGEMGFNMARQEQAGTSVLRAIEVQVFEDGRIWLDGHTLDTAKLNSYLEGKAYDTRTPVFVHAHDDLPVQLLVRVVDVLQRHALSNLQIVRLQE